MRYQKVFEKKGHASWVGCLRFSKDGKYLASGGGDNNILLLDAKNAAEISVLCGHNMGVYSIDFNDDSNFIVSCGYDKSIKLWNLKNNKLIRSVDNLKGYWFFEQNKWKFYTLNHERFVHWDKLIRTNYSSIGLSHVGEFEIKSVLNRSHLSFVSHCRFVDGCRYILSADGDGELFIWDANSFDIIRRVSLQSRTIRSVIYNTNENNIIVAGDNFLNLLCGDTYNILKNSGYIKECIRSLDFICKKQILVTGDNDCKVKIWDIHDLSTNIEVGFHHHCVIYVNYISEYDVIISASKDGVKIWSSDNYEYGGLFDKDLSNISSACLSDDGEMLAFGRYDGLITCYQLFH